MAFRGLSTETIEKYMHTPATKPPYGVTSKFDNPPSLKTALIVIVVLYTVISTFFVATRVYTRHFIVKKLWWDDYFSILAWLLFIGTTVVFIILEGHGAGIHEWNLTYYDAVEVNYFTVITKAFYILDILTLKLSILLQILRIFVPNRSSSQFMFWTIVGLMVASTLFYIIEFCLAVKQCTPRGRGWNRQIPGHCIGTSNIVYTAAVNVISDVIIFVLPLYKIWRLQMSVNKKIGVSLIFSTGLIAVATSVMRLYYSVYVLHTRDQSFYAVVLGFWTYSELFVSTVVGCMPTLPRFGSAMKSAWSATRSKILGSSSKSSKTGPFSRDPKSWNDPKDDSRSHFKSGAIRLDDYRFDSVDRPDNAHEAGV